MSPGTKDSERIFFRSPSRRTSDSGEERRFRASTDAMALRSSIVPMTALSRMTKRTMRISGQSPTPKKSKPFFTDS
ncbi:MAG: hypothetical protein ACI4UT_04110 [Candidatus Enteromonas sp.]